MRVCAIAWCAAIPGLQVYLFRRTRDDLAKNHVEGPKGFRALLGRWVAAGGCEIVADEIRFCNGARIYLCHCKDEKDIYKYQGAEIHVLLIDELTHFTETMYRFLRNRVRMVGITLPDALRGLLSAHPVRRQSRQYRASVGQARPSSTGRVPLAIEHDAGRPKAACGASSFRRGSRTIRAWRRTIRATRRGSKGSARARWCRRCAGATGTWSRARSSIAGRTAATWCDPFDLPEHWPRFRSGDWGSYCAVQLRLVGGRLRALQDRRGASGCRAAAWCATANTTACSRAGRMSA